MHGQQLFLDAIAYTAKRMPRAVVSDEIIAGVEPIEKTLEAIDLIASLGAFPTICVFGPTVGSDMEDWPPPSYAEMRRVMAQARVHAKIRRRAKAVDARQIENGNEVSHRLDLRLPLVMLKTTVSSKDPGRRLGNGTFSS